MNTPIVKRIADNMEYTGVNQTHLQAAMLKHGYKVPVVGTFRQLIAAGYVVRKGETSKVRLRLVNERDAVNKQGESFKTTSGKAFSVFFIEQCDKLNIESENNA